MLHCIIVWLMIFDVASVTCNIAQNGKLIIIHVIIVVMIVPIYI